jgi:phage-related baseplate assembly protein
MASTFNLDDLIEPVSRSDVQRSVYSVLSTLGVNTTSWKPGAIVRTMIVAYSAVIASLSQLQATLARSGFLDLSVGQWLTLVARYVYGVERIEATFATGEITLANSGGGVFLFDPDDLIFLNSTTGRTFRNTAAVSLGPLSTATVAVQATEVGADSTSGPGEIDTMVTVVLGVTCANNARLTGSDAEDDAALRTRCKEKLGSLSPFGPWDSYAYAVRSATRPDGTSIGVTRLRLGKDGFGSVFVTLAGVDGAIAGDPDDPDTDLGIANEAIKRNAVPEAVTAVVTSATNRSIGVTYSVWAYESKRTDAELEALIADAIDAFFRARPIGGDMVSGSAGKLYIAGLIAAIDEAADEIFHVVVSVPAADVTLDPDEVAVLSGTPAATITREPAPEGYGGSL